MGTSWEPLEMRISKKPPVFINCVFRLVEANNKPTTTQRLDRHMSAGQQHGALFSSFACVQQKPSNVL